MTYLKHSLITLAGSLLLVLPATGDALSNMALRNIGQILQIKAGTSGDLFPNHTGLNPAHQVLALDVDSGDGHTTRLLVPGTENNAHESEAHLLYESAHDLAILIWRTALDGETFRIDFRTLRSVETGLEWSDLFSVEGTEGPVVFTKAPLMAATRDIHVLELEDETSVQVQRSIIHLAWSQAGETPSSHYTALSFIEGSYLGWNQTFDLTHFLTVPPADPDQTDGTTAPSTTLTPALTETLQMVVSRDENSLLLTLANGFLQRIGTLEIDILPLTMASLGDLVREEIFSSADLFDPADLQPFTDKIKGSIVPIGMRFSFHPAIVEYVSDRLGGWILEHGADYGYSDFVALGDDARDLTIDLTSSVYGTTIEDPFNPDHTIVEIDLSEFLDDLEDPQPSQLLDIRVVSNQSAPEIGTGDTAVYTSGNGERLLIAWADSTDPTVLHYLEGHQESGWTESKRLFINETFSLERAHQLLQEKIR